MSSNTSLDPVALAQALIRCKSVTPDGGWRIDVAGELLEPAGFTCHRLTMRDADTPDVENLYARLGTGPRTCASPAIRMWCRRATRRAWTKPPFGAEIAGGMLYGRGAVDMKGGIACFLAAALDYLAAAAA